MNNINQLKNYLLLIILGTSFFSCLKNEKNPAEVKNFDYLLHKVQIEEFIQTEKSTFTRVNENKRLFWVAIPKQEVAIGRVFFYSGENIEKKLNFKSEELNQTFDTLFVVSNITFLADSIQKYKHQVLITPGHKGGRVTPEKKDVTVKPSRGCISISELYCKKRSYQNMKIRVNGVVVKVNSNIMGRNWIHIQDGTSFSDEFDLTVTSKEVVKINDTVIFEGIIALDKDFTSGYFYSVIMEEAVLLNKN